MESLPPIVVRRTPDRRRAEAFALGLDAAAIDSTIERGDGEWRVTVALHDAAAAEKALDGFDAEVDELVVRPLPRPRERPSVLGFAFAAVILGMYLATGPVDVGGAWFTRGAAVSDEILHGELYRTVTALCLHANFGHVMGNAVFAALLVGAVGQAMGGGVGALVLVLAGAAGNLVTALWYRTDHLSIGASTAVFAAVGVLATPGTWRRGSRFPAWVAVGASLAFLGMVGTDRQADVVAHVAGMGCGFVLGFAVRAADRLKAWWVQAMAATAALGVLGGSWWLAFRPPSP